MDDATPLEKELAILIQAGRGTRLQRLQSRQDAASAPATSQGTVLGYVHHRTIPG